VALSILYSQQSTAAFSRKYPSIAKKKKKKKKNPKTDCIKKVKKDKNKL
jgi:hypothetical protein